MEAIKSSSKVLPSSSCLEYFVDIFTAFIVAFEDEG